MSTTPTNPHDEKLAQAREWMRQRNIRQLGTEHLKDKKPNA